MIIYKMVMSCDMFSFVDKAKIQQIEVEMKHKHFNCVVAFLAVVMLPSLVGCGAVFRKQREKALAVSCTSCLKQLTTVLKLFELENEGKLPEAQKWEVTVKEYVGDDKLFICPACEKHYTYLGNAQKVSDYDKKDGVVVLLCEGDHLGKTNVAFLDGHVVAIDKADAEALKAAIEAAKATGGLPAIR